MRTRLGLLVPLLLVAGALAPSAASAAEVRVVQGLGSSGIQYGGDPGESNDATLSRDGSSLVFHDSAAPLRVDGCEQVDEHTARCPPPTGPAGFVWALAGDADDRVHVVDVSGVYVSGGPGTDTLSTDVGGNRLDGGSGPDLLTGSTGDDTLLGSQGSDRLYGLEGDDQLAGEHDRIFAARATDEIYGGPGNDVAWYVERGARVNIDLRRERPQGSPGENDLLSGIEGVNTGGGADRIIAPSTSVTCGGRLDEVILPQAETLIGGDCERTRVVPTLVALTGSWTLKANGMFSLPLHSHKRCSAWVAAFKEGYGRVGRVNLELRPRRTTVARMALAERGLLVITVRDCGPLLTFSLSL